jgi:glycine dehydrogenase
VQEPLGIEVVVGCPDDLDASAVFGAIFQYPGTYGHVRDFTSQIAALHAHKALAIVAADPLSLALLKSPGEMGADIAIGSTQRFGVPYGLWWTACGLYGHAGCIQTLNARPDHRRLSRQSRQ